MEDQASNKVTTEVCIHTLRSKMGRTEGKKMACWKRYYTDPMKTLTQPIDWIKDACRNNSTLEI